MSKIELPDIEVVAAKVHAAWVQSKLDAGITSRPSADGEEQMVDYELLSEPVKELDRSTVRAVYAAIREAEATAPVVSSIAVTERTKRA